MDDVDRRALLNVLGSGLDRFDASALAWCLMGNQYHFGQRGQVLPFASKQVIRRAEANQVLLYV